MILQTAFLGMTHLLSVANLARHRIVSFNALDCSETTTGYELEFIVEWMLFSLFDIKMKCYIDDKTLNYLPTFVHMHKHKTVDQLLTVLLTYKPRDKIDLLRYFSQIDRNEAYSKSWFAYFKHKWRDAFSTRNIHYSLKNYRNLILVYMLIGALKYSQIAFA